MDDISKPLEILLEKNEDPSAKRKVTIVEPSYKILHYDCDPILFAGVNDNLDTIVGSLLYEDEDSGVYYHLYARVSLRAYWSFMHRQISYREMLDDAPEVFLVKSYGDTPKKVAPIDLYSIDESLLPTYESFCPEHHFEDLPAETRAELLNEALKPLHNELGRN